MNRVRQIKKQTDNRFLNLYEFEAEHRDGKTTPYFVASRAKSQQDLKALCHDRRSDGVIIYGVYGEKKDKVVLIRQFRYPINDYIYEFPAGLVEEGEAQEVFHHPKHCYTQRLIAAIPTRQRKEAEP